jgi:membrane protein implicated in regulation of membrane protease activity
VCYAEGSEITTLDWWLWLLLGLLLLGIELFTPGGFYLLFFGISALLVGGLSRTMMGGNLAVQVLLFTALSVAGILLFRRALVSRFGRHALSKDVDNLANTPALAVEDLAPGSMGKVELRGASWTARNSSGVPITRGQRLTVERVDGLTLWVRVASEEYLGRAHEAHEAHVERADRTERDT